MKCLETINYRRKFEAEERQKMILKKITYPFTKTGLSLLSNDFIREMRYKIRFDRETRQYILVTRGKEFYKEMFGN